APASDCSRERTCSFNSGSSLQASARKRSRSVPAGRALASSKISIRRSVLAIIKLLKECANACSADCRVADFQMRKPSKLHRADLEVGDTAGLETCATASP